MIEERTEIPSIPNTETKKALEKGSALVFTDTEPTFSAPIDGTRRVYFDGTDYWLYVYSNGGWRKTLFDNGVSDQIIINYTKQDTDIAAGDVVSYVKGGTLDVLSLTNYVDDIDIGRATNVFSRGIRFTAPMGMIGFTIYVSGVRTVGSPTDDFHVVLRAGGSTPGSVTETEVIGIGGLSGTYAEKSVTFSSTLTAGTNYWLEFRRADTSEDANDYFQVKSCNESDFGFYFEGAGTTDTGDTWSAAPDELTNFRLEKSVSTGLYRAIDIPNGIGLQGGIKGIAKTVNTSNVDVIFAGTYDTSGLTSEAVYYLSQTTPGDFTTTQGSVIIGKANAGTQLEIYSKKKIRKVFDSSNMEVSTSNNTIKVEVGFEPVKMTVYAADAPFGSVGSSVGTTGTNMNFNTNTNSVVTGNELWSAQDSGSGSTCSTFTIDFTSVTFTITSSATAKNFQGEIVFEN